MGDLLSPTPLMGSIPSDHPPQPSWEYPGEPPRRDGHGWTPRPHCCTFGELPKLSHCQEWLHQQGLGLGSGKSGACWAGRGCCRSSRHPSIPSSTPLQHPQRLRNGGHRTGCPWYSMAPSLESTLETGKEIPIHVQCVLRSSPSWGNAAQLRSCGAWSQGLRTGPLPDSAPHWLCLRAPA